MHARTLRGGITLSELGLGTAQFGNLYRETTDEEAAGAFETAWASGTRYFDTAPHYGVGLSERRLGGILSDYPREDYVLSTKVGRILEPDPDAIGQDTEGFAVPATTRRVWDFSRDGIHRSIDDSLTRLGIDHIDIAYLHDPDDHWSQASKEAAPALAELRDQGVIGAFGVGINQSELAARFIDECDVDLVMLAGRYTLIEQDALDSVLPLAETRGAGIVIAGVYNSGLLASDRPRDDANYNYERAPGDLVARARLLADAIEPYGVTLPAVALAFPLRHPAVVSVVVGARTASQVDENVRRYETPIPPQLWTDLEERGLIRAVSLSEADS